MVTPGVCFISSRTTPHCACWIVSMVKCIHRSRNRPSHSQPGPLSSVLLRELRLDPSRLRSFLHIHQTLCMRANDKCLLHVSTLNLKRFYNVESKSVLKTTLEYNFPVYNDHNFSFPNTHILENLPLQLKTICKQRQDCSLLLVGLETQM